MNVSACTYKSQSIAQSQQIFAPSHDGETVTFRNSAFSIHKPLEIIKKYNLSVYFNQVCIPVHQSLMETQYPSRTLLSVHALKNFNIVLD